MRIAQGLLTPQAQAQVQAALAPGEALAGLASWADDIRKVRPETGPWHYVDIPLNSTGLDMMRDCPKGNCVIAKIEEFRDRWRNPSVSAEGRREALLFLVHFVGDMHQPLHCVDNSDQGGNQVPVVFQGSATNLHALWDFGLLRTMRAEDELLGQLQQAITPQVVTEWSRGTVEQWAMESWRTAQTSVYGPLPAHTPDQPVQLGEGYAKMAQPVVEQQIEKAGVRLAAILNASAQ
ncbi:MAG: hypothetical protein JO323_26960 [Acidobacteriia bacterium]|nr:hypothetical protein [Terriglobia bacterium]